MRILAALPPGANLFPITPSHPGFNDPLPSLSPPPLPLPIRKVKPPPPQPNSSSSAHTALGSAHDGTRNCNPVSPSSCRRSVLIGNSGVSYLLPGAPFEFQFSYSETPKDKPLAIREPEFLPFLPLEKPLPWIGKTPRLSKKVKSRKRNKKKIRLLQPNGDNSSPPPGAAMVLEIARRQPVELGRYIDCRSREEVLGEPLTSAEAAELVIPYMSTNRQVNLGRDGVTHNMLEMIHSHWSRHKVCRIRCRGVPTMDMDNIVHHLEVSAK